MREGGLVLGPYLRWEKDIIINPSPPAGKNQDLMNSNMTNDTLSEKLLCSTFSIDPQKNGKLAQMDCKKGFVKKNCHKNDKLYYMLKSPSNMQKKVW